MTEIDKKKFKAMLDALCVVYNRPTYDQEVLRIWFHKLNRFEFNQIAQAFDKWTETNKKMATPADIIEICKEQGNKQFNVRLVHKKSDEQIAKDREHIHNIVSMFTKRHTIK